MYTSLLPKRSVCGNFNSSTIAGTSTETGAVATTSIGRTAPYAFSSIKICTFCNSNSPLYLNLQHAKVYHVAPFFFSYMGQIGYVTYSVVHLLHHSKQTTQTIKREI